MAFGRLLSTAITDAGMSQRAFARRVNYPVQSLNQVIKGTRLPPRQHIDRWATALASVVDPTLFRQTALLEHCPPEIQALVASLLSTKSKPAK